MTDIKFSNANTKIKKLYKVAELSPWLSNKRKVYSFDLLSGHSCPFASDCLSKAIQVDGKRKIKDGPNTKFRCFSASQEVVYTNTYKRRKANFESLRHLETSQDMADLIQSVMPKNTGIVRIHVAGDFFNYKYFLAWIKTAERNPDTLFYAYTKSLVFWIRAMESHGIPSNLVLTASRGGRRDDLIDSYQLRESIVVFSEQEAENKNLVIDYDDSHAARPDLSGDSFALLIHGVQQKGSEAADALKTLKRLEKEKAKNIPFPMR